MRLIQIGIGKATDTHCKDCPHDDGGYCLIFGRAVLTYDHKARSDKRLTACKEAESE